MSRIELAIDIIVKQVLEAGKEPEKAIDEYTSPIDNSRMSNEEFIHVKPMVLDKLKRIKDREQLLATIEDPTIVSDPEIHKPWYDEWKNTSTPDDQYYWNRLQKYLAHQLSEKFNPVRADNVVASIDKSSNMVLSHMEDPKQPKFHSKGLVIGHVQSGKTANFTAVIAKAADAGYKLIIVLAGLHNNLRSQTQLRLDKELTGAPFKNVKNVISPPIDTKRWAKLTGGSDFVEEQPTDLKSLNAYNSPILLVVKKRPEILNKLIKWLGNENTDEAERMTIPTLVIDDEADLASIDTTPEKEGTPTNKAIRKLLQLFDRHSYIGYTATPFANMFIDKRVYDSETGKDLYPRNFIVSLPKPEGYMGPEKIFNSGLDEYLVKTIKKDEVKKYSAKRHRTGKLQMTPKLKEAFWSFVLSSATRYLRGQSYEPMTMLIHTTHRQYGHENLCKIVEDYKEEFTEKWNAQDPELLNKLRELWVADFINATKAFDITPSSFEDISVYISEFLSDLNVFVLNSDSDDELDYTRNPDLKVVAIGGNTLSRGLTLEGLVTSFFLRNTKTYDSLLQMGRWFGYREGYEDMTRVYTSEVLARHFEDLALVEEQMREDLLKYQDIDITPKQLSPIIRAHKNMKITAPNKMGAASRYISSYSTKTAQTTWLPLEKPDVLNENLTTTKSFFNELYKIYPLVERSSGFLFENVDYEEIIKFLSDFHYDELPAFDHENIISYIERLATEYDKSELTNWNVAIPSRNTPYHSDINEIDINEDIAIIPVNRSKPKKYPNKIGSLTSEGDFNIDSQKEERKTPLLLLYFISKNSRPLKESDELGPLFKEGFEKEDVVGLAIAFPRSTNEPGDLDEYISQPD